MSSGQLLEVQHVAISLPSAFCVGACFVAVQQFSFFLWYPPPFEHKRVPSSHNFPFLFFAYQALFLLYESASGYGLFERVESEQIGAMTAEVIATQTDLARFSKLVRMKAFLPFVSAEQALENQNDISEGTLFLVQ